MIRFAFTAAILLPAVLVQAQTAFEPHTVAYALCVTNETKKLAQVTPEIAKDLIIERAFAACKDEETGGKKILADKGMSASAIDERFAQVKKFIRLTAPDDIDRQRVNRVPR
jgi:hypothetical protein